MYFSTLALSMQAPDRQRAFRRAVALHLTLVGCTAGAVTLRPESLPAVAQMLLVAGIVEGAMLIGWRLTQIPKSQALEFLLVSPVRPRNVLLSEALSGLARLALLAFAGLPVMVLLVLSGRINATDVPVLLLVPWTWGAVTGVGLTAWAYEPARIRRTGEYVVLAMILVYLIVGVLAGEKLRLWLSWLPDSAQWWFMEVFGWLHTFNPFGVVKYWFEPGCVPTVAAERMLWLQAGGVVGLCLLSVRAAGRLRGHFHDRHYRPISEVPQVRTKGIDDAPLAWWAVRRVMEYSGRSNLYLAGGFGVVYAAYTVAGAYWPDWMGKLIFQMVERAGGIPTVTTGLVLLAAVPAAFQYGLWDSNAQDRCRRLELLLLTDLRARDYYEAAAAAAWRRGRGYFATAGLLWLAAGFAGRASWPQISLAAAAGVLLWAFYFALGFRAFARGRQANGLGSLLTIGVPILAYGLNAVGLTFLSAWTPPGSVFHILNEPTSIVLLKGPIMIGIATIALSRSALRRCIAELRDWYDRNHGKKVVD